jgi:hypothetical protein
VKLRANPLVDARNDKLADWRRVDAVREAWANADPTRRAGIRESLKDQMWSQQTPPEVRIAIIDTFAGDTDPTGLADTRNELRGMLPVEPDREVVSAICRKIVAGQWTEFGPALVRSYAREVEKVPDEKRAERIAMQSISPSVPPERVAFDVFLHPPEDGTDAPIKLRERTRQAAWDLLAPPRSGRRSASRVARRRRARRTGGPRHAAAARELRVVPISGGEIAWMTSLLDSTNTAASAWLARATPVISSLRADQAEGLACAISSPSDGRRPIAAHGLERAAPSCSWSSKHA